MKRIALSEKDVLGAFLFWLSSKQTQVIWQSFEDSFCHTWGFTNIQGIEFQQVGEFTHFAVPVYGYLHDIPSEGARSQHRYGVAQKESSSIVM
jgi:hypothetical protein